MANRAGTFAQCLLSIFKRSRQSMMKKILSRTPHAQQLLQVERVSSRRRVLIHTVFKKQHGFYCLFTPQLGWTALPESSGWSEWNYRIPQNQNNKNGIRVVAISISQCFCPSIDYRQRYLDSFCYLQFGFRSLLKYNFLLIHTNPSPFERTATSVGPPTVC